MKTQNKECVSIVRERALCVCVCVWIGNCEEARLVCSRAVSCVAGPPLQSNQQLLEPLVTCNFLVSLFVYCFRTEKSTILSPPYFLKEKMQLGAGLREVSRLTSSLSSRGII